VEENNNAGTSTEVPRRTLRSAKAEAVKAAQEASSAGASQLGRVSKGRKEEVVMMRLRNANTRDCKGSLLPCRYRRWSFSSERAVAYLLS
jgi:hypothetical protein